ncbi:MAG TPA: POTRA domain-containing protein, partial [Nitrososphaera sp.]|nr:POTRA domain-containing protein [Nitrososphaera sp.]
NISGEVQHLTDAPADGPIQAYEYKVSLHPIVIRNVDFPGATEDENAALQSAAKPLSDGEYFRSDLLEKERSTFLPIYQSRGYLKAEFGDAHPRVVEDGARTVVDVSLPVTRGQQYKLKALIIHGNRAISADQLKDIVKPKFGEPIDTVQLEDDLAQIKKLYATKGYLFAHVETAPEVDDATGTVICHIVIKEGDIYRMGDLSIEGLPEDNANRMAAQWQMKKGDPFDDSYMKKFFDILYRDFDLRRSYEVASKRAINQQDKTVSVSLHFVPKS